MTQNSGAPGPPPRVRLDSWKEIAEYLGRDIRTVLRWEQERGLPVHTIPSGKRRSVFAYQDELDAWLATGSPVNEDAPSPQAADAPFAPSRPAPGWLTRIPLLVRWAGLLLLVALVSMVAFKSATSETAAPPITSVQLTANTLHALRDDGGIVWSYPFPGAARRINNHRILDATDSPTGDSCRVLTVTAVLPASANSPNMVPVDDRLSCLSNKGQLVWEKSFKETLQFGTKEYGTFWGFRALWTYRVDGQPRIAASLANFTWWPSPVLVFDREGNRLHTFVNAGWVTQLQSLENPSGMFLLAGGISNSNDAGMMAVLDGRNPSGTSPERAGSEFECSNCPGGHPLKYFVFPRSELNLATGSDFNEAGPAVLNSGIEVHTIEVKLSSGWAVSAVYEFTRDFELKRATFDHRYWELHRRLELEGKLDHTEATCPERLGPRLVRVWDPQNGWQELHPNSPAASQR